MAKKTKAEIEAELAAAAAAAEAEAVAKAEAEVKERAEAEAAERKRKEVETQRRAEEVERIRQGHKDKVASEQAAATLLHQLSRVHSEAAAWRKHRLSSLALNPSSQPSLHSFLTAATDDLEAALAGAEGGLGIRDGLSALPSRPLAMAMATCSVLASGAATLQRQAAEMVERGSADASSSYEGHSRAVYALATRRLDATTAAFLEVVQAGGAAPDHMFNLKDGIKEMWLHDAAKISETAQEGQQTGIDNAARRAAGAGVGILREQPGAEVLLWANMPPGRAGRARVVSSVALPTGGAAAPDGRTELSVELHKAIVNSAVVLRVTRTAWDHTGTGELQAVEGGGRDGLQARMANDTNAKGGKPGAKRVASARPPSSKPEERASRAPSRPASAKDEEGRRVEDADRKEVDGEDKELGLGEVGDAVPDAAALVSAARKAAPETPLDPYAPLRSLGGVLTLELLGLPPTGTSARQWSMLPQNSRVGPLHSVRRLPHPLAQQGPSAMQSQAVRVKLRLPSDIILPPAPVTVASLHPGVGWRTQDITEVNLDASSRQLSWSTIYFSPHALVMPRHTDLPFSTWSLRPTHIPEQHAAAVRALHTAAGAEGKLRPSAVLFTLTGPRFTVSVRVLDTGCVLEQPQLPELAHVIGVVLPPGELVALLSTAGLVVQPAAEDVPYINRSGAKPGRGSVRPLHERYEASVLAHLCRCAGAYEVCASRWNSDPAMPADTAVFLAREHNEQLSPGVGAEATAWRTVAAYADTELPSQVRFVLTTDAEPAGAARWVRRVQPEQELARAQAAEKARAAEENTRREEAAAAAREEAEAAAAAATEAAGEGAEPVLPAQVPSVEYVTATTLTMDRLPAVEAWRGIPEGGDAGLSQGDLADCLASRASPAAVAARASTSPLLADMARRLLTLVRPLSFTA